MEKKSLAWEENKVGSKRTYSMSIELNDNAGKRVLTCDIAVKKNGDIEIDSIDPSWHGRTVQQSALILSETGYIKKSVIDTEVNDSKEKVITYIAGVEKGYSVFEVRFLQRAKELPNKVKQKFSGAFGIK